MKLIIVVLTGFIVSACGGDKPETDADRVREIVRDTAYYGRMGDDSYNLALDELEAAKLGKPLYEVVAEMKTQTSILDVAVSQLAGLAVNECPKILNVAAKESLDKGVRDLYAVNKLRHNYLSDVVLSIGSGSADAMRAVADKYGDSLNAIAGQMLESAGHILAAKKAVGLPETLDEFR